MKVHPGKLRPERGHRAPGQGGGHRPEPHRADAPGPTPPPTPASSTTSGTCSPPPRRPRAGAYGPGRFSFNVRGGRCEACSGDGVLKIEMHFLPDIFVPCEVCKGRRYNRETLEVRYKGRNIADVLEMTVDEAVEFFSALPRLRKKLETLQDVGLGYVETGSALHGALRRRGPAGEAGHGAQQDRHRQDHLYPGRAPPPASTPTTCASSWRCSSGWWITATPWWSSSTTWTSSSARTTSFDLGPEGGDGGGTVVCTGTPEEVAACPASFTGQYLKKMLEQ